MNVEEDRQASLAVLSECMSLVLPGEDRTKEPRIESLIARFSEQALVGAENLEFASGWFFCLRPCFRAALDIQRTPRKIDKKTEMVWTQGSRFHFKNGDTLYDSPRAYSAWNLNNFRLCIDVTAGAPAQPPVAAESAVRDCGFVAFNILVPDASNTKLMQHAAKTMSQDDFVKMLIVGPPAGWGLL